MSENCVAIIGMAGRYPQSENLDIFWDHLLQEKELISTFSTEELTKNHSDGLFLNDPAYVKRKGIFEGVELFDAHFFGFSNFEALITDPQQRIMLEIAWEALENAGYTPENYDGSIGVFAGSNHPYYLNQNVKKNANIMEDMDSFQITIANEPSFLSTKISYKLNLTGPSLNINTACSTSLTSIATAYKQLINYECDMALAGGISIMFPHKNGYVHQPDGILSSDGHCRAFDHKATGTVSSDGAGIVVLKRLEDALEDGDHIEALIIGAAINNDGHEKIGFTAPSVQGQSACIIEALESAEISADSIQYIETHGTGTKLGDPIEVSALTNAFSHYTNRKNFCAIGSVKTNIGHTDAAAGVAGLIKTALSLKHKKIPASINYEKPNPSIDFDNTPFYVNQSLKIWDTPVDTPRRASVSSFGIGGTNAHVILEEAPKTLSSLYNSSNCPKIITISAKTPSALKKYNENFISFLESNNQSDTNNSFLDDLTFTLHLGRKAFPYRHAIVCQNIDDAIQKFKETTIIKNPPEKAKTVFMFSGQGSQYSKMGFELYQTEPVFQSAVNQCAAIIKNNFNYDLLDLLYPQIGELELANEKLKKTQFTQPALFTIEYAIAKLLMHWGITPQALIGHSIGEFAAAHLAGIFSLEEALLAVSKRAELISQLESGSMLMVPLSENQIVPLLEQNIGIAAINSATSCIVSGPKFAIEQFNHKISKLFPSLTTKLLKHASHAFHSCMLDPILDSFENFLNMINFQKPSLPIFSCVMGRQIEPEVIATPQYWRQQLRNTVRFSETINQAILEGYNCFLEVGPGTTLRALTEENITDSSKEITVLNSLPHPKEHLTGITATSTIYQTLADMWMLQAPINWKNFHQHQKRHRLALPTYPFERQPFLIEPDTFDANIKLVRSEDYKNYFYLPSWQRYTPLYNHASIDKKLSSEHELYCWIIFADSSGLANTITEHLRLLKQNVLIIQQSETFSANEKEKIYYINPNVKENYIEFLKYLEKEKFDTLNIIHLWNITSVDEHLFDEDLFSQMSSLGIYSLTFFAQAAATQLSDKKIDLLMVSNHLFHVLKQDKVVPQKSLLLGACKVIPQELDYFHIKTIDIDSVSLEKEYLVLTAKQLLDEILRIDEHNFFNAKAYRNHYVWNYLPAKIRDVEEYSSEIVIKPHATYLITGGLGGMGITFSQYLSNKQNAIHLILVNRSEFLQKSQWDQWLKTHPENDKTSQKIKKLQDIEKLGTQITILQTDITDEKAITQLLKNNKENISSKIHGVIHTAGVAGGGLIQNRTLESIETVLKPKVQGTLTLFKLLQKEPLDFFVMCSSLASILGFPGQIAYTAANTFLDAIAEMSSSCLAPSCHTLTINWPAWAQIGMAVNSNGPDLLDHKETTNIISPETAVKVLDTLLHHSFEHVLVSTTDIEQYAEHINLQLKKHYGSHDSNNTDILLSTEPNEKKPNYNNIEDIQKILTQIFKTILKIETLKPDDNFFDLGGHSLLALQLIRKIQKIFQVKIALNTIYQNNSVISLAKIIHSPQINHKPLSPLITLKKEGNKEALFLLYPVGGTAFCYIPLAKELKIIDRPIYALQHPNLEQEKKIKFQNFEEMASYCLEQIQTIQPHGPYFLAGASLGGVLAFEIASQLEQQGEKVDMVTLFDSWAKFSDFFKDPDLFQNAMMRQHLTLKEQLESSSDIMIPAQPWLDSQWESMQLMLQYIPNKNTQFDIVLFKATDLRPEYVDIEDLFNGWDQYIKNPIKLHRTPGDHETMLDYENIKEIIDVLTKLL